MKTERAFSAGSETEQQNLRMAEIVREIVRAVQSVQYGSVEVIIQNSRVVQIERKEKFRFDKPAKL